MRYVRKDDATNPNVSERAPLREAFQLAAGFAVVCAAVVAGVLLAGRFVVTRASPAFEARFQDLMAGVVSRDGESSPRVEGYLAGVLSKLRAHAPDAGGPAMRVALMCDSSQPNAFAIPGRLIGVTSPLLWKLDTEEGLAFVLAHELGHFHNRDHLHALGQTFGLSLIALLSNAAGLGNTLTEAAGVIGAGVQRSFSREQETRADAFARDLMRKAYGTNRGAVEVMRLFVSLEEKAGTRSIPVFLRTHPHSEERLAEALATVDEEERGRAAGSSPERADVLPADVKESARCTKPTRPGDGATPAGG